MPRAAARKDIGDLVGKIHNKDCIKGMQQISDGSVHLAFADPPFNIGYDYDVYDDKREREDYLKWSSDWMAQVHRVLSDTGAFWLAIGDEYAAELKIEAQQLGFHCRSWVIWYYTFGVHCSGKFTRSHAHLFHFVKDAKSFTFNGDSVRVPSARQLIYNDKRANSKGRMPDDTWILRPQEAIDGFDPDDDVWYFPRVAGTFKERAGFHGCQMPEQLLGRIVRSSSNEGEVVLDPFSGSATTLATAKKLNRLFVGFELSKEYAKLGRARLKGIAPGDGLDGSEEPQVCPKEKTKAAKRRQQSFRFASGRLDLDGLAESAAGLIESFARTHDGFSVDRVIADPNLNEQFQDSCEQAGVEGAPAKRNRGLFRLRKAGSIARAGIEANRRTNIGWRNVSRFIFASEIAWRRITDVNEVSLDELLCDPRLAAQFDEIARGFAPGFMPLEYRWGALKLRKAASTARSRAKSLRLEKLAAAVPLSSICDDWNAVPDEPGVYAITDAQDHFLFASETENLRARLDRHFSPQGTREQWRVFADGEIRVRHLRVDSLSEGRLALQTLLVRRHQPELNMVSQLAK